MCLLHSVPLQQCELSSGPSPQAIPLYQKAGAGLAAGGMGALVGSPADLSLIRMQVAMAPERAPGRFVSTCLARPAPQVFLTSALRTAQQALPHAAERLQALVHVARATLVSTADVAASWAQP